MAGSAARGPARPRHGALAWGVTVLLGLAGCAGAQAPTAAEQQAGEAPALALSAPAAAPAVSAPPPVVQPAPTPLIVPPAARQAVESAYEAAQKKRWAEVDRLAPLAAPDPVLGLYPRYWALRNRLQNRTLPVPDTEVRLFLADAAGT